MSKIPTTDTILKKHLVKALEAGKTSSEDRANAINDAMKEFGELVREETLKVVAKEAKTKTHEEYISKSGEYEYTQYIDKQSILDLVTHPNLEIK